LTVNVFFLKINVSKSVHYRLTNQANSTFHLCDPCNCMDYRGVDH